VAGSPQSGRVLSRFALCGLVVLALICLVVGIVRSARQPSFQGRSVSEWFAQASDPTNYWWMQEVWVDPQLTPTPAAMTFRQTLNAFVQMGADSVPYLIGRLNDRRPFMIEFRSNCARRSRARGSGSRSAEPRISFSDNWVLQPIAESPSSCICCRRAVRSNEWGRLTF